MQLVGVDAYAWRRFCSSFKSASADLCNALAGVARRLCTSRVDPEGLSGFVACRLAPLDKNRGVRPIGIGEVPQLISAVLKGLFSGYSDFPPSPKLTTHST